MGITLSHASCNLRHLSHHATLILCHFCAARNGGDWGGCRHRYGITIIIWHCYFCLVTPRSCRGINNLATSQLFLYLCAATAMGDLLDSMLDLMRRLPPTHVEENVASLVAICPDYADDLLGSVDQPLKLMTDRATGKDYLACDYNRDGESYRYTY